MDAEFEELAKRVQILETQLAEQVESCQRLRHALHVPDPAQHPTSGDVAFLEYANCQAADFFHPRYAQLCKLLDQRPQFHRKQWEHVYIVHKLVEAGVLRRGARGLGFGVGKESLPAVFASAGADIVATDAPEDGEVRRDWVGTEQHSDNVERLLFPAIAPDDVVRRQVHHQPCDMNAIDPSLRGFDFNWSACCFEHLGSIEAGIQFVINAVESTLRVGGVAVHTTEFNVSSNSDTIDTGTTVIFRRRDMEDLIERLRNRGHIVDPFVIGPAMHQLDFHVDVPPYRHDPHLKLLLAGYVTTSVGVTVRRGR